MLACWRKWLLSDAKRIRSNVAIHISGGKAPYSYDHCLTADVNLLWCVFCLGNPLSYCLFLVKLQKS